MCLKVVLLAPLARLQATADSGSCPAACPMEEDRLLPATDRPAGGWLAGFVAGVKLCLMETDRLTDGRTDERTDRWWRAGAHLQDRSGCNTFATELGRERTG